MTRAQLKRAGVLVVLALWFAAAGGLLQVLGLAIKKALGGVTHRGVQVVWMAPLAETIVLLVPGILLFVLGFWWQRARHRSLAIGVYAFLSSCSLLLLPGYIAWWSATLLALGVAWEVARRTSRHASGFARLVRITTPIMVLLVVGLATVVNVRAHMRAERFAAQLPKPAAGAPNIIVIIWDTVRAQSVSWYNRLLQTTPNLDDLATHGVVFENAIATAPWTLPSHVSMFTGLYSHQFEASWAVPYRGNARTLAEALSANGYRTGAFVGNLIYTDAEHGLTRGFGTYRDHALSLGEILNNSTLLQLATSPENALGQLMGPHHYLWHKDGRTINREFLHWAGQDSARPFFAFLNYFDAHDPYIPPARFAQMMGATEQARFSERARRVWQGKDPADLSAAEGARQRLSYDASIRYLDSLLGELVKQLGADGRLRNTIIVITSDHGEEFGEHGRYRHGDDLYLTTLHVPLVILAPGRVPAGTRVSAPVTLRDLPATLLETAGARATMPGRSWSQYWQGRPDAQLAHSSVLSTTSEDLYGRNPAVSVVAEQLHYIQTSTCAERLFDLKSDPLEQRDLRSALVAHPDIGTLRMQISDIRSCERGHTPAVAGVQQLRITGASDRPGQKD